MKTLITILLLISGVIVGQTSETLIYTRTTTKLFESDFFVTKPIKHLPKNSRLKLIQYGEEYSRVIHKSDSGYVLTLDLKKDASFEKALEEIIHKKKHIEKKKKLYSQKSKELKEELDKAYYEIELHEDYVKREKEIKAQRQKEFEEELEELKDEMQNNILRIKDRINDRRYELISKIKRELSFSQEENFDELRQLFPKLALWKYIKLLYRKLFIGMTKSMALHCLGNPYKKNIHISKDGKFEKWSYENLELNFKANILKSYTEIEY